MEDRLDGTVLIWHVGDLRPKGIERSAGKLAVWTGQQVVVMGMRDTPPDGE